MILSHSVVALIPCYNVAQFCELIVRETAAICTYVIVIDDGSTDGTGAILQKIVSEYPKKIHVITFPQNRGKGFGLIEGFKYALDHFKFDVLITLDGDGQHNPSFISSVVEPIFHGADFVIGARSFKTMPSRNRFANTFISFLLRRFHVHAPFDTQSGMRAFTSDLVRDFVKSVPGGQYEMEFCCLLHALEKGRKIVEIPIATIYIDKNRSSHFSPLKDSYKILKVFVLLLMRKK